MEPLPNKYKDGHLISQSSMGADMADVNNDGKADIL
jgi:hypothetical protein